MGNVLKVFVQEAEMKEMNGKQRAQAWNEVSFHFMYCMSGDIFQSPVHDEWMHIMVALTAVYHIG